MSNGKAKLRERINDTRMKIKALNTAMDDNPCRTLDEKTRHGKDWDAVLAEEELLKKLEYNLACITGDDS